MRLRDIEATQALNELKSKLADALRRLGRESEETQRFIAKAQVSKAVVQQMRMALAQHIMLMRELPEPKLIASHADTLVQFTALTDQFFGFSQDEVADQFRGYIERVLVDRIVDRLQAEGFTFDVRGTIEKAARP